MGTIYKTLPDYRIHIGIDPGTNTGVAVWDKTDRRYIVIVTCLIHEAMWRVLELKKEFPNNIYVRVEDARLRKWFQNKSAAQLQGAGSIKRDCTIWSDFLSSHQIPYECVAPKKGMTKWSDEHFRNVTKYTGRTSTHSRDAAVLVFDR